MKYNEHGEELPDDTPVEVPFKFKKPPTMNEMIALYVKNAMALERQMGRQSKRSEVEEEEDFDIDEDGEEDVMTPYELHALASETEREYKREAHFERMRKERDGKVEPSKDGKGDSSGGKVVGASENAKAGAANAKDGGGVGGAAGGVAG